MEPVRTVLLPYLVWTVPSYGALNVTPWSSITGKTGEGPAQKAPKLCFASRTPKIYGCINCCASVASYEMWQEAIVACCEVLPRCLTAEIHNPSPRLRMWHKEATAGPALLERNVWSGADWHQAVGHCWTARSDASCTVLALRPFISAWRTSRQLLTIR
jgi:hypothetical protein